MTLALEKCVACRRDSPRVTHDEIGEFHREVADWDLTEHNAIKRLDRTFKFSNFAEAMEFTKKVGQAGEDEGHHPRITTEWGRVNVAWWTHKIRGLHQNDFIAAAKTDRLAGGGPRA